MQNIIFEVAEIVGEDDIEKIVNRINKENIQSLDALWEVIVIYLLSQHGDLGYEIDHGGRTKPDIYLKCNNGLEFVADITCISDQDQEKNNDVNYFNNELSSVAKKLGINDLSGFYVRIEGGDEWRDKKVKLRLPNKNETHQFISSKIKPYLIEVSRSKNQPRNLNISESGVELSISYSPVSRYFTSSYPSFTIAKSLVHNPLYNRLKAKGKQLRGAGYNGCKGLIVCDGGCSLISSTMSGFGSHGIGSIIERFLQQQDTISFVIAIYVEEGVTNTIRREAVRKIKLKYAAKENCKVAIDRLIKELSSTVNNLPIPISTAKNASFALKSDRSFPGNTFYGGFFMSGGKISLSSRTLLKLIAGDIDAEQMIKDHGIAGTNLKNRIRQGYKLDSIELKRVEGADDDWVEFCFEDDFDPSVSKYIAKNPNN